MPSTTEINISEFADIQTQKFDIETGYLPLGVSTLKQHMFGKEIASLMKAVMGEALKADNALSLKVEDNFPSAIYGFRVLLNKDNVPTLSFGSLEKEFNEIPITVVPDPDEDDSLILKAGKATVEFEVPKGGKATSIECYVWTKKIRVKAYVELIKDTTIQQLNRVTQVADLVDLLGQFAGGGSYSFKLKNLTHPKVLEAKNVKLPLTLNVDYVEDEVYQGDNFVSRNIHVSNPDGSPIWGIDKNDNITEVKQLVIYGNSTAGSICEEVGLARFLLCKLYDGKPQLIIVKANKNPEYNPKHILPFYPSANKQVAAAYDKAKQELLTCIEKGQNFYGLLNESSKQNFLAAVTEKVLPEASQADAAPVAEVKQPATVTAQVVPVEVVQESSSAAAVYEEDESDDDDFSFDLDEE